MSLADNITHTKQSFVEDAIRYIRRTISDGLLDCRIEWRDGDFAEHVAESFHRDWNSDNFIQAVNTVTKELSKLIDGQQKYGGDIDLGVEWHDQQAEQ